ncbi:hypothetical protein J2Y48_005041 [Mycoplana sp. BE70]|nr:hypothetical protein [Mycoplana sp. BE70]
MDFSPIATPLCLAIRESVYVRYNACESFVVYA